jgi:hypothetical protein
MNSKKKSGQRSRNTGKANPGTIFIELYHLLAAHLHGILSLPEKWIGTSGEKQKSMDEVETGISDVQEPVEMDIGERQNHSRKCT